MNLEPWTSRIFPLRTWLRYLLHFFPPRSRVTWGISLISSFHYDHVRGISLISSHYYNEWGLSHFFKTTITYEVSLIIFVHYDCDCEVSLSFLLTAITKKGSACRLRYHYYKIEVLFTTSTQARYQVSKHIALWKKRYIMPTQDTQARTINHTHSTLFLLPAPATRYPSITLVINTISSRYVIRSLHYSFMKGISWSITPNNSPWNKCVTDE